MHSKILEAKIKGENYFTGEFLLSLNFGTAEMPTIQLSDKKIRELERALFYQLNERISFIKPKDKIVAVVLFELGNIKLMSHKLKEAQAIYAKAKEYGFSERIIDQRLELSGYNLQKKAEKKEKETPKINVLKTSLMVLILLISILFGYIVFKKNKKPIPYTQNGFFKQ